MGDIEKTAKILSTMHSLDIHDPVALQSMENDLELERNRIEPYTGELLRSGIYHIEAEK